MVESIVEWFTDNLSGLMPKELIIFLVSMFPILELRGGLIAASILGVDIVPAIIICLIGNILPIPFILLFITKIFEALKKTKFLCPLIEKLEAKGMKQRDKLEKYEFWGLVLFVGIPLPGTGAWTGSLAASLLGMELKKSVPSIAVGLLLATTIMTIISYGIPYLISLVN